MGRRTLLGRRGQFSFALGWAMRVVNANSVLVRAFEIRDRGNGCGLREMVLY
jgi:hypothetical protein